MGRTRWVAVAAVVGLVVASLGLPAQVSRGAAPVAGLHSIAATAHRVDLRTASRASDPNEIHGLPALGRPPTTASPPYAGPQPRLVPSSDGSSDGSGAAGVPRAPTSTKAPEAGSTTAPRVAATPDIQVGASFPGLSHCSVPAACTEPPDATVAVNGSFVVQMDNVAVAIYSRSGTAQGTPTAFSQFFGEPSGQSGDTDPHVLWDAVHGRWFATETSWACSTQTAMLYLAVSDTADPRSTWHIFQLSFNELPDYPALAVSSDKVVLSANLFPFSGSGAPGCFGNSFDRGIFGAIDLAPLLATPSSPGTFTYSGQYFTGFSWRPAGDPTSSTVYAVAENVAGVGGGVLSGSVSGTQAAKSLTFSAPYDLTAAGKAAAFALPPAPEQQGSPATIADAVDERPTDAVWAGGHLWFVATAPCTPSGDTQARDCVRLVELGTGTATPTVQQDFEIADNGFDDFMGGIGVSGVGALIVVFSQSSPTSFVSTYARVQEPGAATATLGAPLGIEQGLGTYTGTRWGDYVLLSRDPAEPTAIWQADEYPTADGRWATTVSQLLVEATYVALPGPARILDTRSAVGLSGPFVNHKPRTFQVTGRGGVPAGAVAVTGNLTITGQQAAGYVSLTTTPLASPTTSTLNLPLNDVRANGVTTPLGSGGTLSATYVGGSATSSTQLVFDVTGYFVPAATGTKYTPLPPGRILDTRTATGLSGPFVTGVPRAFAVVGRGGVPTGAVAVTGNLTVTGQTAAGYVSLTTKSTPAPGTSTLNFPLKDVRANGVTMPLGTGTDLGKLWATYIGGPAGSSTALVFDVTGYYAPGASGAFYVPLTPVRALDTRSGNGLSGPFVNHVARTLQITGRDNVPAAASGITGNLTMVGQTASGYVSITLAPETSPTTSTLNAPLGDIRANNLAARLTPAGSGGGRLSGTYVGGPTTGHDSTQLILDITGYFIPT